ncbi:hypothetical protein [Streptomyces sp. MP131-18]|uniref:hypothetical protein n=1 Tax=Streptomyces sp. MP131-18 TaxID=1857892 RepID=UPI0009C47864|nr:hypothetical protein [Streptomyces sp. MP131-18]ONK10392.1 hypothetical protein STBA_11140 [Streptomyces sp. MP131-18]
MSETDYTIVIDNGDGEAPYLYVVRAPSLTTAKIIAWAEHIGAGEAEMDDSAVRVQDHLCHEGTPSAAVGFWNDLREGGAA